MKTKLNTESDEPFECKEYMLRSTSGLGQHPFKV